MIGSAEMRRAAVYERLAVLENAGIPLREGVAQVATQGGEGALALGEVLRRLNAGSDVAGAFLDAPAISDFEAQMIRAGERAGRLPEAFQELGRFFEGVAKTKRQLAGELAYPVFVAHLAMVIPSIPLLVLGGPEEFLWAVLGPLATVYGLGGAVWVGWKVARARARGVVDRAMLSVPLLGRVWGKRALARSLQVLKGFQSSGVGILESLETAGEVCPNREVGRWFWEVRQDVVEGSTLSEAMGRRPEFPSDVVSMVSTGERAGTLPEMLEKVVERMEDDAQRAIKLAVKVLGVGAFLVVAMFVAYKVISMYAQILGQVGAF